MGMYKRMLLDAKHKGLASENKMWQSLDSLMPMLATMEAEHPDEYWKFIRSQHELLYGSHYDEKFANEDVNKMYSTGKDGKIFKGAHWTKQEVLDATKNMIFPSGVTDCDKFVAFNGMWHDMHNNFSDGDIIDIAYAFFFDDEDWSDRGGKTWKYFNMK